jgi:hypothetical protein
LKGKSSGGEQIFFGKKILGKELTVILRGKWIAGGVNVGTRISRFCTLYIKHRKCFVYKMHLLHESTVPDIINVLRCLYLCILPDGLQKWKDIIYQSEIANKEYA